MHFTTTAVIAMFDITRGDLFVIDTKDRMMIVRALEIVANSDLTMNNHPVPTRKTPRFTDGAVKFDAEGTPIEFSVHGGVLTPCVLYLPTCASCRECNSYTMRPNGELFKCEECGGSKLLKH